MEAEFADRASRIGREGRAPWLGAVRSVLLWAIPATLALYTKHYMMNSGIHGGYFILERSLGHGLNAVERLSFYRADLLIGFFLVPLGFVVLSRCLPSRWRNPFLILLCLVISLVLCFQLLAYEMVGRFLSLHTYSAALSWAREDPSALFPYLNPKRLVVAVLGLAVLIAFVSLWNAKRDKWISADSVLARIWRIGAWGFISCLALITVAAWAQPLSRTPFHESVLGSVLRAMLNRSDIDTGEFRDLPMAELANRYREMVASPLPERSGRYRAKAKSSNVIFFVLETAPAKVLPAGGGLADFPNLRRLRETSFVAVAHYTPYCESHQAIFSILSSCYPSSALDGALRHKRAVRVPGMISTLSELGYDTAFYSPIDFRGEPDSAMYSSLGFQRQVYPKRQPSAISFDARNQIRVRMGLDVAALNLLRRDLERDLAEGRRFAYLFAPELSHAPWPDLSEDGKLQDVPQRGRALLQITDQWLGEITQLLERNNQLKNTIIVVVGDHGVRSQAEDPSLSPGTLDDYSFHVPLVIFAPMAVDHAEKIPWLTSHIDIAPSVLDLLGIEQGRTFEQGTAIWNPDLANRTTCFWGRDFLGVDGYYSRGKFFMWSRLSDAVYQNTKMSFDQSNVALHSSSVHTDVTRVVNRLASLNEVWVTRFSEATLP
jgi:glucan phosphoethanolaminetransferase (alkaline phosphatase superfamily)